MVRMGLDQSMSSSGIAIFSDKTLIHNEIFKTVKNADDAHDIYKRVNLIVEYIIALCVKFKVQEVTIEGLGFGASGNATRNLAGLQFCIITRLIKDLGIHPKVIAPTSLKKQATGSGKASKDDMVNSLKEVDPGFFEYINKIPKTKGRYDLADAYWLGFLEGEQECTTTEQ